MGAIDDYARLVVRVGVAVRPGQEVLVSAQHAFLPVPNEGKATFWPVIFNYQSTKKNPGVLAILVTRQGTSMTIIDNSRDTVTGGDSWGQRLYFNQAGNKAPLIAAELEAMNFTGDGNGLDMVMMPQELRQKVPTSNFFQQTGYERNPIARRTGTVAALFAAIDAKMDEGSRLAGARDLAAGFDPH